MAHPLPLTHHVRDDCVKSEQRHSAANAGEPDIMATGPPSDWISPCELLDAYKVYDSLCEVSKSCLRWRMQSNLLCFVIQYAACICTIP